MEMEDEALFSPMESANACPHSSPKEHYKAKVNGVARSSGGPQPECCLLLSSVPLCRLFLDPSANSESHCSQLQLKTKTQPCIPSLPLFCHLESRWSEFVPMQKRDEALATGKTACWRVGGDVTAPDVVGLGHHPFSEQRRAGCQLFPPLDTLHPLKQIQVQC